MGGRGQKSLAVADKEKAGHSFQNLVGLLWLWEAGLFVLLKSFWYLRQFGRHPPWDPEGC